MSRNEKLLQALIDGLTVDIEPQSRAEAYLKACCNCNCADDLPDPISRNDLLLYELAMDKVASSEMITRNITSVKNSSALKVGQFAFAECEKVKNIALENVTSIEYRGMYYAKALESIHIPNVETIGREAFDHCINLEQIELPKITSIEQYAFNACWKLVKIIIGTENDSVCSLTNANAFNDMPISSGNGYIFVPDILLDDYKSATNWSTFSNQIKGISELN